MHGAGVFQVLACAATLLILSARGTAEEPKERVRAECHMVIVPQADALVLVPDLQDEQKIEAAWLRILEMVRNGSATLVAHLMCQGAFGGRMQSETTEELRYATNYEPPQLPAEFPQEKGGEVLKGWPHVGITPTSFETRSVGQTLQIEITREPQTNLLWVQVEPQHVRFLRWEKTDAGRLRDGERLSVEQPIFHSMKCQERFPLVSGGRILLSVHKVPDAEKPSFELFLLRVSVVPAIAKP